MTVVHLPTSVVSMREIVTVTQTVNLVYFVTVTIVSETHLNPGMIVVPQLD